MSNQPEQPDQTWDADEAFLQICAELGLPIPAEYAAGFLQQQNNPNDASLQAEEEMDIVMPSEGPDMGITDEEMNVGMPTSYGSGPLQPISGINLAGLRARIRFGMRIPAKYAEYARHLIQQNDLSENVSVLIAGGQGTGLPMNYGSGQPRQQNDLGYVFLQIAANQENNYPMDDVAASSTQNSDPNEALLQTRAQLAANLEKSLPTDDVSASSTQNNDAMAVWLRSRALIGMPDPPKSKYDLRRSGQSKLNEAWSQAAAELATGIPKNYGPASSLQAVVQSNSAFSAQQVPSIAPNVFQPYNRKLPFPSYTAVAQAANRPESIKTIGVAHEDQGTDKEPPAPISVEEWKSMKLQNRVANRDPSSGYACMRCSDGFTDFWGLVLHEKNAHPPVEKPLYPKGTEHNKCVKCNKTFQSSTGLEAHEETCFLPPYKPPNNWDIWRLHHDGFTRFHNADPLLRCPVETCRYFGFPYVRQDGTSNSFLMHMFKFHDRDVEILNKLWVESGGKQKVTSN